MGVHGVSRDEQRLLDITYVAATGQQHEYLVLALREAEGGGHITATVVQRLVGQLQQPRGKQEQGALGQHEDVGDQAP